MRTLSGAAALVLLAGCGSDSPGEQAAPSPTSQAPTGASSIDVSGKATVDLAAEDFRFAPASLVGTPGQKLSIHLSNTGAVAHTFTLAQQQVDETVDPAKNATFTITMPASGRLEFVCRFHPGMTGDLSVGGAPAASPTDKGPKGY